MAVTIRDVAKKAGVSVSTVSRVINNKGVISDETRDHILKIMHELNYFPNFTARSFANGNTMAIALIIDVADARAYSNAFFNKSVFGIETAAHLNGYNLIITSDHMHSDSFSSAEKLVFEKKVDGIILPTSLVKRNFITRLRELNFPFVILGEPALFAAETNWADINNVQGGELAATHLASKGYHRIAFLSTGENEMFNRNRITGFRRGADQCGLTVHNGHISHCVASVAEGYVRTRELLLLDVPPDSVICSDYLLAFGALRAARDSGLRVPQDFGIVSFDDSPVAELAEPSITTVDIDTFNLGEQAAALLIQAIGKKDGTGRQTLISTRIIERQSTGR